MASLVAPLACGVIGATSGSATFYNEGTGTLATVYSDPEGVTIVTTHTLDSNGGIVRYVNNRVDVVVKDAAAATVRTFTWGTDARECRVENAGFTGTLAGGGTAAGGRTTVDAVLTSLYSSLGSIDGKVLVNGSGVNIQTALAGISGLVFNVKAYGAVGNGVTNDRAAIIAAIAAAIVAGGGTIFFPPGTYLIAGQITVPSGSKVVFLGASAGSVTIKQSTTAVSGWFLISDPTSFREISFGRSSAGMTGAVLKTVTRVSLYSCVFAGWGGAHFYDDDATGAAEYTAIGCRFTVDEAAGRVVDSIGFGSHSRFLGCDFVASVASAVVMVNNGAGDYYVDVAGSYFTLTAATPDLAQGLIVKYSACTVVGLAASTVTISGNDVVMSSSYVYVPGGTLVLGGSGFATLAENGNKFVATTVSLADTFQSGFRDHKAAVTTALVGATTSYTPADYAPTHFVTYPGTNVGTLTINAPTFAAATGTRLELVIYQSGASGPSTLAWNGTYQTYDTGGAHPAMTATIAQNDVLRFAFVKTGGKWIQSP